MIWGSEIFDDFEGLAIWRCWFEGFENLMILRICYFEDLDIYGFWGFGVSRIWRFDLRILRALGFKDFEECDLKKWAFEGFGDPKDLIIWRFSGFLGFAGLGILKISGFGDLRIWWFCLEELVICGFWEFGDFEDLKIWGFGILRILCFEDLKNLTICAFENFSNVKISGFEIWWFEDFGFWGI